MSDEQTGPVAYAISYGSYSDYGVDCILLDKDEAEQLCAQMNQYHNGYYERFVEEFPLVRLPQTPVTELRMDFSYGVRVQKPGTPRFTLEREHFYFDTSQHRETERTRTVFPFEEEAVPALKVDGGDVHFSVWGYDIERVRKVYSERRAQIIAEKEGLV